MFCCALPAKTRKANGIFQEVGGCGDVGGGFGHLGGDLTRSSDVLRCEDAVKLGDQRLLGCSREAPSAAYFQPFHLS